MLTVRHLRRSSATQRVGTSGHRTGAEQRASESSSPSVSMRVPHTAPPAPRSPSGPRSRGTLCKCNLSAGPASARKLRAGLPGTRLGALGAGRRPVNQRRLTENQTARAAGRPRASPSRRLRASLAARRLFVPPARPALPGEGLRLSITPPFPPRCSVLSSLASRSLPILPDCLDLAFFPFPGPHVKEEALTHPVLRQPLGGRLGSPECASW